jgi:hypothetical protein
MQISYKSDLGNGIPNSIRAPLKIDEVLKKRENEIEHQVTESNRTKGFLE